MKAFITALLFLFCVTVSVFLNSLYSATFYRNAIDLLETFPAETGGDRTAVGHACELLNNKKKYMLFTMNENTANEIFIDFAETVAYFDSGDNFAYRSSLEKVKLRLKIQYSSESNFITELFIGKNESKKRYFP
ncbi:MAG: hypothetical protein IKV97_05145 [Clostridia bacterium]|nr:hypothetical protein [Clostridia bacterium]